jgi:hypothetical protein
MVKMVGGMPVDPPAAEYFCAPPVGIRRAYDNQSSGFQYSGDPPQRIRRVRDMFDNLVHRDKVEKPGVVHIGIKRSHVNVKLEFVRNTPDVFVYLDAVNIASAGTVIPEGFTEAAPDIKDANIFRDPGVSHTSFPVQPRQEPPDLFPRLISFEGKGGSGVIFRVNGFPIVCAEIDMKELMITFPALIEREPPVIPVTVVVDGHQKQRIARGTYGTFHHILLGDVVTGLAYFRSSVRDPDEWQLPVSKKQSV